MSVCFWCSLGVILYTYAGYPVLIWALAKLWPKPYRQDHQCPSVSVILAVHNGIGYLPRKIEHLLGLPYPHIEEIIIVSDGSTDGSNEFLRTLCHPRLHAIILDLQQGKAAALNFGMAVASSELFLFVDIRPELDESALLRMAACFADPLVGCVAAELRLVHDGHDEISQAVGGLYWRYEQWIRKCEAAFDSPVGVYGGCYAVRRSIAVPQPPGLILDDMFEPLSIIRQGYRSVIAQDAFVYDKWPTQAANEFQRKVRTAAGNFQLLMRAPWTLTPQNRVLFQLLSHKVLRLAVPYLALIMLVSSSVLSLHSRFYTGVFSAQLIGLALAAFGQRTGFVLLKKLAAPGSALLMLNAAAVVGLFRFLFTRGPLWRIWTTGAAALVTPCLEPAAESLVNSVAGE